MGRLSLPQSGSYFFTGHAVRLLALLCFGLSSLPTYPNDSTSSEELLDESLRAI